MNRTNLHNYQQVCVNHIINTPYCGLFLDMGLGKTAITLTAIEDLMSDYMQVSSVLIVAPKRVAETVWQEEAAKWDHLKHLRFSKIIGSPQQRIAAIKKPADVYIVSRDNIAWLCLYFGGQKLPYDMVVADELSSFKSYKAQRFKALRSIRPSLHRFVGLTGTPASNGLIDLWPQVYLMDRGIRLGKTISNFRQTYFKPLVSDGFVVFKYGLLPGAEESIRGKIADICISMQAEDYLTMPDKINNIVELNMPTALEAEYDKFEKEKVLELVNSFDANGDTLKITSANAMGLSNKLLQFANGAIYDNADKIENRGTHIIHDIKLEALKEIIDDANGQSVLVAWTFQSDRDRIISFLKGYDVRELKTDKDIKDWNDGNIQVLIAHPASAGHGLNLQAGGNIIVWFGLTWSLELYQQFNARLYRQGQQNGVVINHLVIKGTEDENVIKALQTKDKTQASLLDCLKVKLDKYTNLWKTS